MTFRGWDRFGPATGVLSVGLFIVTMFLYGNVDTGDTDQELVAYFAKHSHQSRYIVAFFVFFAALALLLAFLSSLRGALIRAEGEPGRLTALAFSAGVASTILLRVANTLFALPAVAVNNESKFVLDPNTFRLVDDLGYLVFISGVMTAFLLVLPTSVLALRTALFPRWFGWLGIVAAIVLLAAVFFLPVFVLFGWVLVASLLLLWRGRSPAHETRAVPPATP